MIRYNQIIKDISIEDDERVLKLGELNMINKMEGQVHSYNYCDNVYSEFEREFKLYETSKLLSDLSDLMDLKSNELINCISKIEKFTKKAQWLKSWTNKTKNDILLQANSGLIALDNNKLDKLQRRISRYEKYFDLMEEEEDELKRYEYTFNFLIDIPAQINLYVEEATNKYEKFEAKSFKYIDQTEKASSLEDVFSIGLKFELDIAA